LQENRRRFLSFSDISCRDQALKFKKFPVVSLFIREFATEKGSIQTAPSATQFVGFAYNSEKAANWRVDGPIRSIRGTGETEQCS
jgi:hypothetical protein